ncbi:MAG: alpha-amylase [Erysipelotrichaceae bacterium]|nr:alpha-amylase [Erysipelotrichaceae bacterium]
MKETMLQTFEWYLPDDGKFWSQLAEHAGQLSKIGYTMTWLPPAAKGFAGTGDVGYGVYDLYDLGEFDQKGTVRTKYGTREEYLKAVQNLKENGIKVISDIVLNHRMGADEKERVTVQPVDSANREQRIGSEYETEVWTKFTFPGRRGAYSDFQWTWDCFTGTDYDASSGKSQIMLFQGKGWNQDVSREQGNFDYIMGNDVDFNSEKVRKELFEWGKWFQKTTGSDGYRLDAVKSIDFDFFSGWLEMMYMESGTRTPFAVGEYWSGSLQELEKYLDNCQFAMNLFDVPLHFRFQQASTANGQFDVRTLFDNTLTTARPKFAIPFVDNHDTQPGQALESWVLDWFKPHAYASILLHKAENACVFIGDVMGISHSGNPPVPHLNEMVWIRSHLLSDEIAEFFDDDPQKAAWLSCSDHPVMVLYTIGDRKQAEVSHPSLKNRVMVNIMNPEQKTVCPPEGSALFEADGGSCAVFLSQEDYEAMKKAFESDEQAG